MPKPTTNATYSSDYYYGLYIKCKNNISDYNKEHDEIVSKKERYYEERIKVAELRPEVKTTIEEVCTLKSYLENVVVDGTPFDKGMCYTNKNTLDNIYNFLDKLFIELNSKSTELLRKQEELERKIDNEKVNKTMYWNLYQDAKEKEELAAKSGRGGPTRGTK